MKCFLSRFVFGCGLLAAALFGASVPSAAQSAPDASAAHPPIPVRFTLKKAGSVTLVIEDAQGVRVRNLVSETPYPAGPNVVWWDGLDDLGRNADAARHGVYDTPGTLVPPGTYRMRGLVRPPLKASYVMAPYFGNADPPWSNGERSSEWLANHTPPSAMVFVPAGKAPVRSGHLTSSGGQILVGSYVAEGGSGVAWLDTSGSKIYGQMWIGGVWTGATQMAYDSGPEAVPGLYAYTASAWENELRLYGLNREIGPKPRDTRMGYGDDKPILQPSWKFPGATDGAWNKAGSVVAISGLAAHNALIAVSLPKLNQMLFVDAAAHRALGTAPLPDPRGLAFDSQGRLLMLSGTSLLRCTLPAALASRKVPETKSAADAPQKPLLPLPSPQILALYLDDPQNLTLDAQGNIYVSERGTSHQIKVFTPEGKPLRSIGHAGPPTSGPYDPEHLNNPDGMAIDDQNHLWVAETDFQPKRVSVWDIKTGKLWRAFYGGPVYGGGGQLDPRHPNLFYYSGMTLALNRTARDSVPVSIYYRNDTDPLQMNYDWGGAPQQPIYAKGRTYLTDCYNLPPTNGIPFATLWQMQPGGIARAAAALGRANDWKLLKTAPFRSRWPAGVDPDGKDWWYGEGAAKNGTLFVWSDLNGDGKVQPEEVQMQKAITGGVTVMSDLSIVVARAEMNRTNATLRFVPAGFTAGGAPIYSLQKRQVLAVLPNFSPSSGGDQAYLGKNGWTFFSTAPAPYSPYSVAGVRDGKPLWSYPNMWPGLHASHDAPLPDHPGEIIGLTKMLGPSVTPKGDAGEIMALNGNKGNVYLMTTDGLFVATLFRDCRTKGWDAPKAVPGQDMLPYSLGEESFFPTITQTSDGSIYLQGNTCLMRLEGLDSIERLPAQSLTVSGEQLAAAQAYFVQQEVQRQQRAAGTQKVLTIALRKALPKLTSKMEDWPAANWVPIDNHASAALATDGSNLYAAFKTGDDGLLNNRPQSLQNLFKSGGALDIMLDAIPGGERLLVAKVGGKTTAVLYRPHVPGTTTEPVKFVSNIGALKTVRMDRVDDVSSQVTLTQDGGNYLLSVPLALLGLEARTSQNLHGDIGLLRGNGFQTLQRVYWHSKATGLVSDLASEAELTPSLWGMLDFK